MGVSGKQQTPRQASSPPFRQSSRGPAALSSTTNRTQVLGHHDQVFLALPRELQFVSKGSNRSPHTAYSHTGMN
jgi:hypothetical protein